MTIFSMFLSAHSSAQDCLLQQLRSGVITPPTDNEDVFKMWFHFELLVITWVSYLIFYSKELSFVVSKLCI